MNDHYIPAPWGRTPRPLVDAQMAADMDDCGDWAIAHTPRVGRLDREDIEAALRDRSVAIHGELAPAEELQRDVDMSHRFPLEGFFRRHPTAAFWLVVLISVIGAAIDSEQLWSN